MRRALALWLILLFGIYAATLGLDAFGNSEYGGDEPHYLLAAESIVEDGDVDVKNQYAERAYDGLLSLRARQHGRETEGRLHEPHGVGLPAADRPRVRARRRAGRRAVPRGYRRAGGGARLPAGRCASSPTRGRWARRWRSGLSPPFLAYGTAVYPELTAAAALAGAALLAARLESACCAPRRVRLPRAARHAALAGHEVRARRHRDRRVCRPLGAAGAPAHAGASASASWPLFSAALYVGINEALYGGPTPYAADVPGETATDASFPGGYLARAYRLGGAAARPRLRAAALGARVPARLRRAVDAATARAGTALAGPCPTCARRERVALMCAAALAPSCWWPRSLRPRCSASGFRPGTCWRRCRWPCRSWRGGCGTAPAHRQRPRAADGGGVGVALRGRAAGLRRTRDAAARRAVRAAHRGVPVFRRLSLAVRAGRGARRRPAGPGRLRGAELAPAPRAPRAARYSG